MKKAFIIFPHQLFQELNPLLQVSEVYLIEEFLFFRQYNFHKQKLVLHRSSMKYYEDYLKKKNIKVHYIDTLNPLSDIRKLILSFSQNEIRELNYFDVCDDWLDRRIKDSCEKTGIIRFEIPSPLFLNSKEDLKEYFEVKQKYFQTDFYIQQRKKFGILLDEKNKPTGGKWSFDAENRLKYPAQKKTPLINFPSSNAYHQEAIQYVSKKFPHNPGFIEGKIIYPSSHEETHEWLMQFLSERFDEFGMYEDAIVKSENILHHSVLTPVLNIGLITPSEIIRQTLNFASQRQIPLNSLEGFIRQIIGWREFIRGVYLYKGRLERTSNFWKFSRKIPDSFYKGNTGIEPIDHTIRKVLETGYCHHIERLMILGNFMLLCGFHPNEVYRWFMELFIDAYDWVMVPNVYGMSQFADGGLMATKPYISGSSYVLKMSDYKKTEWCGIWDALFWSFMNTQRNFFKTNPRLGMLLKTYDNMTEEKKEKIQFLHQQFIATLI